MEELRIMRQHIIDTLSELAYDEKKVAIKELLYYNEYYIHCEILWYINYWQEKGCLPSSEQIQERLKLIASED